VLTAAQVNTYLNEQTVMVFADSAARTTALSGVLAEGMMSYLQDTNAVEVYNGTAWVGVGNVGDITEVQAGVGISVASGTGPIPVITNSSTDLITTAGDILYGTAADTVARLGIGTANQVLKVNSGATAPEWAVDPTTDVVTTAGDLIYGTAADTVARLGIGTAGQVLAVNSGATAPEWVTPAAGGGALTLISRQSFSVVATGSFEGVLSSTYDSYLIIIEKVFSSSSNTTIQLRYLYSTNTEQASGYYGNQIRISSVLTTNNGDNVNQIDIADKNSSNTNQAGRHTLWLNMVNNQGSPQINSTGMSGDTFTPQIMGYLNTTSRSYTGLKFFMSGGDMTATIAVYGVAK
jgi:hypothetical protein